MLRIAGAVITAALLAACQSTPSNSGPEGIAAYADDPRLGPPVNNACFTSTIDSFSMNERDTVVLRAGRKHFMVETFGSCMDLENAMSIGVDSATSCLSKSDALIVSTSLMGTDVGMGPQRCMIKEIREWNPDAKPAEESAATPAE